MTQRSDGDPPWAASRQAAEDKSDDRSSALDTAPAPDAAELGAPKKRKSYVQAAVKSLLDGEREAVITQWLRKKGLDEHEIEHTLERARKKVSEQRPVAFKNDSEAEQVNYELRQRQRSKDLLYGSMWFAGGLCVTVASYAASGGKHFVLAWGPALYGAARLFRALSAR